MSAFAFLIFCVQVCLIQNVYSQCIGAGTYGQSFTNPGLSLTNPALNGINLASGGQYNGPIAGPLAGPTPGPVVNQIASPFEGIAGAYGGFGIGDVTVLGEMPVAGTTLVTGQVPILGAVRFSGDLPAGGIVTISGSCGCGSNSPIVY
ncbi:chorion class CA protein ERA.5-like [Colias croceus]|uniref:chorion class CA protein ERA.5-like n=1 Tax=Colias crocea TaxID=72248 RepID=UPI001E27EB98|nr:chorion class CA protein ERA.5-like [Colias croceus]